jgi:hypothetical protein
LWKWAAGGGAAGIDALASRSPEQEEAEDSEKTVKTVRENVLWILRRGLEEVAESQRGMVEKRIERAREKEKSVLYKVAAAGAATAGPGQGMKAAYSMPDERDTGSTAGQMRDVSIDHAMAAEIESQLSPEQLQLFAQENDTMLKHYEDTLSKVQYV